jgi:DNA replication licensing factor MCM3
MAAGDVDQRIRDIQREYAEFLDDYVRKCWYYLTIQKVYFELCFFQNRDGIYTQLVKDMVSSKQTRLIVNINDLRRVNVARANG